MNTAGDMRTARYLFSGPWTAAAVFVVYAAFLFLTLPHYGVTWDEVGWFSYGYQQWDAIRHGHTESLREPYADYFHYGSLPSMAAAAMHHVFHTKLHWVSPDVGYHLANVGFALLLALGIMIWGSQALPAGGAALALLIWMLLPRLWPDAHYNISDLPGATGCLWTAWCAWRISRADKPLVTDYVLLGLAAGIAYTLRAPNVYFLALAILIWVFACRALLKFRWDSFAWWGSLVTILVFFITVKTLTPGLWHGSVVKHVLWSNPQSYLDALGKEDLWFMGRYYPIDRPPLYYAPWFWLVSTPLIVIACWAIGAASVFYKPSASSAALLLWLILWATAVFKHALGSGNYDGVRHFLEAYAPMSLLAAQGALILVGWVADVPRWPRRAAYAVVVLGVMAPIYTGWRIHPYQSGYFNVLAGSLPRAWRQYEVEYWGQSFLPGSKWVKQHIDPEVPLYVPDAAHIARFYLRPPFKVNTMKPYWAFSDVGEFQTSLRAFLDEAPVEAVLLKLNRPRLYRGEPGFDCPEDWKMIHREGPDPDLPSMMIICRKAPQTVTR